jgi:hypothetical protein
MKTNNDYRNMIMRYLNLAFLATTILSQSASVESSADANMARQLAAQLDYPVKAYICQYDDSEDKKPVALTQGSVLKICIKVDDSVVIDDSIMAENIIIVEDILSVVISQPEGTATDSEIITNAVADTLTYKVCRESGMCNVKSQLQSKFFSDSNPGDLRVDGVAILAISSSAVTVEGSTPAVRRLRAPIRSLLNGDDVKAFMAAHQHQKDDKETAIVSVFTDSAHRMLQDDANLSEFSLEVGLQGESGSTFLDAVVIVGILVAVICLLFWFRAENGRRVKKEEVTRHNSSNPFVWFVDKKQETTRHHSSTRTADIQSSLGNKDSVVRAQIPSSGNHTRTLDRTSNSRHLCREENGTTYPDQHSAQLPTTPKDVYKGSGRSRHEEEEDITWQNSSTSSFGSILGGNDSAARAQIPSSGDHSRTLDRTSNSRHLCKEENGTTYPDRQLVQVPTTPKDTSHGSGRSYQEEPEGITCRRGSILAKNCSAARAQISSSDNHPRTLERTSNSRKLCGEENGTTCPDQNSDQLPTTPKDTYKGSGRSRHEEEEDISWQNSSATRAQMPSSERRTRKLKRTSNSRHLCREEKGTTDPEQQSADTPNLKSRKVSKSSPKVSKSHKETNAPTKTKRAEMEANRAAEEGEWVQDVPAVGEKKKKRTKKPVEDDNKRLVEPNGEGEKKMKKKKKERVENKEEQEEPVPADGEKRKKKTKSPAEDDETLIEAVGEGEKKMKNKKKEPVESEEERKEDVAAVGEKKKKKTKKPAEDDNERLVEPTGEGEKKMKKKKKEPVENQEEQEKPVPAEGEKKKRQPKNPEEDNERLVEPAGEVQKKMQKKKKKKPFESEKDQEDDVPTDGRNTKKPDPTTEDEEKLVEEKLVEPVGEGEKKMKKKKKKPVFENEEEQEEHAPADGGKRRRKVISL